MVRWAIAHATHRSCRCRGLYWPWPRRKVLVLLVMEGRVPKVLTSWRWRAVAAFRRPSCTLGSLDSPLSIRCAHRPWRCAFEAASADGWAGLRLEAMRPHLNGAHRRRRWRTPNRRSGGALAPPLGDMVKSRRSLHDDRPGGACLEKSRGNAKWPTGANLPTPWGSVPEWPLAMDLWLACAVLPPREGLALWLKPRQRILDARSQHRRAGPLNSVPLEGRARGGSRPSRVAGAGGGCRVQVLDHWMAMPLPSWRAPGGWKALWASWWVRSCAPVPLQLRSKLNRVNRIS